MTVFNGRGKYFSAHKEFSFAFYSSFAGHQWRSLSDSTTRKDYTHTHTWYQKRTSLERTRIWHGLLLSLWFPYFKDSFVILFRFNLSLPLALPFSKAINTCCTTWFLSSPSFIGLLDVRHPHQSFLMFITAKTNKKIDAWFLQSSRSNYYSNILFFIFFMIKDVTISKVVCFLNN